MSFLIAPSILSADFANLARDIELLSQSGADWIHVDVMDGHFVPNLTIGPPVVAAIKNVTKLPLDVHLMIESPEKYVDAFIQAGADWLTIHVESTQQVMETLQRIRSQGVKAGLTLRPGTSLNSILPYLEACDLVLIMTVEPGFGGQVFMGDQIEKISHLRKAIQQRNLQTLIEVDGGINEKTAGLCKDADVLVAGSYIFSQDPQIAISKLKNAR